MILHNIFSVPIMETFIDNTIANKIEKTFLKNIENIPKKYIHYTDYGDDVPAYNIEKEVPEFCEFVKAFGENYRVASGIRSSFDKIQYWTQDYRDEGQHHNQHHHGINGISGVYWIRANSAAGEFAFITPNVQQQYVDYFMETDYSFPDYMITPEKGKMVLFPSYLQHHVAPSGKNAIRSTIAFNFIYEPRSI